MPKYLTPHFTYEELNLLDVEYRVVNNYYDLCVNFLEPIREKWGPTIVTSGYRTGTENDLAGGKTASYHLALDDHAAVDFKFPYESHHNLIEVFDWIRLFSSLPFDKVILEFHANTRTPSIIHAQYTKKETLRRLAYEGFTGACERYTKLAVV